MDFDWTEEQRNLAESTLQFAQSELNGTMAERDAGHEFGQEEWIKCGRFGLLGASIGTEFGGRGLDCLTTARVFEAFGQGCRDGGLGISAGAHLFASALPIARFAEAEAKQQYLKALVSGESIGANAITESEAGSDVFSLKMRAEKRGDAYRLHGEKVFVTNGPIADLIVVYAVTRPSRGYFGVSAFIVESGFEGVTIGPPLNKIGLRTSPTGSICFDDCVVPERNRLGAEGQGGAIFQVAMDWERTCLFAFWLGTMERQLHEAVQYAKKRRQFGRPIGANQAVSHRLADMKVRLESSRMLLYRACSDVDRGRPNPLNVSIAKLALSEAAVQSSLDCLHIFGGLGLLSETGIERYLRDTVAGTIYSGTSEMHREIIARHLGLYDSRQKPEFSPESEEE
jgi:alkylation response protein AidB-like acyl-CoA dehydrogenase